MESTQSSFGDRVPEKAAGVPEREGVTFFLKAPRPHPAWTSIRGWIYGVRDGETEDPFLREIR